MKKLLTTLLLIFILFITIGCNRNENLIIYSNRTITDIDVSELIDDRWFDYSYFWQQGKDENGKDLTIVTIYFSYSNGVKGTKRYITDGTNWEHIPE